MIADLADRRPKGSRMSIAKYHFGCFNRNENKVLLLGIKCGFIMLKLKLKFNKTVETSWFPASRLTKYQNSGIELVSNHLPISLSYFIVCWHGYTGCCFLVILKKKYQRKKLRPRLPKKILSFCMTMPTLILPKLK